MLLKKDGKNLSTSDYALNLSQYLNQAKSASNLSMGDLRNVLNGLKGSNNKKGSCQNLALESDKSLDNPFLLGEAVTCAWHENVGDNIGI